MATELPFVLETETNPIHGLVSLPAGTDPRPTVVLCHGFKGFMDWGFFSPLADLLVERGLVVVRFNFSGIGQLPGDDRTTDVEAFRANTFSREQDDLFRVLGALGTEIAPGRVDLQRVGLFGHSRGGGVAILAAGADDSPVPIRALVTWAAVGTFHRFDEAMKKAWREEGSLMVLNGRTGQRLPLGLGLLQDLEKNSDRLDIEAAAARCEVPWCIVHGTEDDAVGVEEGRRLMAALNSRPESGVPSQWIEIEGGNHTFGATQPFRGPTPHLVQAMNATQRWLLRFLR